MLGRKDGSGLGLCLKPELLLCREGPAHTLDSVATDGHWDAPPLLHGVLPVEQSYSIQVAWLRSELSPRYLAGADSNGHMSAGGDGGGGAEGLQKALDGSQVEPAQQGSLPPHILHINPAWRQLPSAGGSGAERI